MDDLILILSDYEMNNNENNESNLDVIINFKKYCITHNAPWTKEQEQEHEQYSENLGVSYDDGLRYRDIVVNWDNHLPNHKVDIGGLLKRKDPEEFLHYALWITDWLFLWSKNLIVDDLLDDLAKYVLANQLTGNEIFFLNRAHIKKIFNTKKASRPMKADHIYIDTLMAYLESGSISKTARVIGRSNKTVREDLKRLVGDYNKIQNKTHPLYKDILKVYDIWKSKQK